MDKPALQPPKFPQPGTGGVAPEQDNSSGGRPEEKGKYHDTVPPLEQTNLGVLMPMPPGPRFM